MPAATDVATAPVVVLGIVGGYVVARETRVRALGGVVLGAAGAYAARTWLARTDVPTTAGLLALYVGALGASHPLARRVGAWPSVLGVAAVSAGVTWAVADRR